jgi:hypothetical protein
LLPAYQNVFFKNQSAFNIGFTKIDKFTDREIYQLPSRQLRGILPAGDIGGVVMFAVLTQPLRVMFLCIGTTFLMGDSIIHST